jgi:voltage-gated potassium channel
MKLKRMMGIAGVPLDAPYKAQLWGKRFDQGLVIIFLLALLRWSLEPNQILSYTMIRFLSWLIWGYFVVEMIVCISLVEDKRRYIAGNWANWIIIIMGFPLIFYHSSLFSLIRLMQIVLAFRFSKGYLETSIKIVAKRYWVYTMCVLLSIVIISAFILSLIDPAFKNIGDGLWFAWESMTTVGYGDFLPQTTSGRLFTTIIIFIGIILVSMMTASFAAVIINKDEEQDDINEIKQSLASIKAQLQRIEDKQ